MPEKRKKPGTINRNFTKLINFLAEKTKNVTKPLSVNVLSREFKKHSRSSETINCLYSRILLIHRKIHSIQNFDTDTKVKMMFALSAPLDYGFLHELKDRADVKLDDSRRIIEYETKGGGLKLKGEHVQSVYKPNERSKKMLAFLAEKAKKRDTPMTNEQFAQEFIKSTGNSRCIVACEKLYRAIKNEIYESNEFDKETKIRMLFVSSAKLHSYVLEELRKDAHVEVDDQNRITMYMSKDESLVLAGEHTFSAKKKLVHTEIWNRISQKTYNTDTDDGYDESDQENDGPGMSYQEEMADLIQFVAKMCQSATNVLSIKNLCREYKSLSGSSRQLGSLESRIRNYRQRIHSLENIDSNSKVKQMFSLSASIDSEYLEELQKNAVVDIDDKKRIIKYEAKDGSLKLQGDHSQSAKNKIGRALSRKKKKNAVKRGDRRRLTKSKGERNEQKKKKEVVLGYDDSEDDESDESETGDDEDVESDESDELEEEESEERNERDRRSERISSRLAMTLTRKRKRRGEEDAFESRDHQKRSSQIESDSEEGEESGQEIYEDEEENEYDSELADEEVDRMMTSRQRRISERRESISNGNDQKEMDDSMEREYRIDDYEMNDRNGDYNGMESFNTHDNDYHSKEDQRDISERMKESIDIQSSEVIHSDDSEKKEDEDSNRIHENQKNQEQNGNSFISIETHLKFLESIQTIVSDYNDPSFNSIQLRIRQKIEKIKESGNNEEKVTINEIRMILNTILSIVTKNAVIESINNHESSTNLTQFLLIFRIFVISIQIPVLDTFQTKIRALILDPSNQNKRFPARYVRLAVEMAVGVVAPLID